MYPSLYVVEVMFSRENLFIYYCLAYSEADVRADVYQSYPHITKPPTIAVGIKAYPNIHEDYPDCRLIACSGTSVH
jgi:hypothetical protein